MNRAVLFIPSSFIHVDEGIVGSLEAYSATAMNGHWASELHTKERPPLFFSLILLV